MMGAGSGIAHSEFNHSKSEPVRFLHIWIVPDKKMVAPRYQQIHFSLKEKEESHGSLFRLKVKKALWACTRMHAYMQVFF